MVVKDKQRTIKQNDAMHLYFTHLADELNAVGLDMKKTLKPEIDIPWSGTSIKEYIWRPIQIAQLGKKSTTELTTKEIDLVFNTISRFIAERFGLVVDFPSIEAFINREREL